MISRKHIQNLYPGIIVAAVLGLAAQSISDHYGAPVMLMALLLGMALNFLSHEAQTKAGINFSAQRILRFGVALLGARISFDMIAGLGVETIILTTSAILLTIGFGLIVGGMLNESNDFSFLTAGSVAICGASAAMAIGAVLPPSKERDEQLVFTVAGVTLLSTLAMVLYPVLVIKFGFSPDQIGVFLGATIHDIAQVVGAGYSVSDESGDIATIVKLLRVVMLAPIIIASLVVRRRFKKQKHSTGHRSCQSLFLAS